MAIKPIRTTLKVILALGAIAGIAVGGYYGYRYYQKIKSEKKDVQNQKSDSSRAKENQGEKGSNNINREVIVPKNVEEMFYKPENLIRVGHWNILNYGSTESSDKNGPKVRAIAELIYKSKQDVVGLTEINYNRGEDVKNIVDVLNSINSNNSFKYLIQPTKDANPTSSNATKEQVAIIYNYKRIKEKNFTNGKNIQSYGTTQKFQGTSYKRPLFAAYFETIEGSKPFVSIFGHLDSPAVGKNSTEKADKTYKGQGAQEVAEASEIANAFKYYEELSNNASIIFGGDTNIKTENNRLFNSENFIKNNIENYYGEMSIFEDKKTTTKAKKYEFYETSLGTNEKNGYANAYDKLLFKENGGLNIINEYEKTTYKDKKYQNVPFKADIINGFKNGIWDRNVILNLRPKLQLNKQGKKISDFSFIRNKISDHTLVYLDFEIK
ncbi:hypothetical protein DA803_01460 [[Mycoplasma] phocae]|uniref:Nuclease n=1 Tax=[Mycoplasma] phocae TaxID=142651 RepID=A0A2Z5IQD8_9BACT|nr:hypothetical protein [[Mycoplasma] phocae]AXE60752.1 hypothetical protein DA803_01460 [[Mycoplasma] phocae]